MIDDRELFDAIWWGLGTFILGIVVIIAGLFLSIRIWPPDKYLHSEPRIIAILAVSTGSKGRASVDISVDGHLWRDVDIDRHCEVKTIRGHFTGAVDIFQRKDGSKYAAVNIASLRRGICS